MQFFSSDVDILDSFIKNAETYEKIYELRKRKCFQHDRNNNRKI